VSQLSKPVLAWQPPYNLGTELLKERIQLVDVLATAGAEAEVVNAGCEFLVRML
jgi:hypothetical protein